jgi:hypothetical protein
VRGPARDGQLAHAGAPDRGRQHHVKTRLERQPIDSRVQGAPQVLRLLRARYGVDARRRELLSHSGNRGWQLRTRISQVPDHGTRSMSLASSNSSATPKDTTGSRPVAWCRTAVDGTR